MKHQRWIYSHSPQKKLTVHHLPHISSRTKPTTAFIGWKYCKIAAPTSYKLQVAKDHLVLIFINLRILWLHHISSSTSSHTGHGQRNSLPIFCWLLSLLKYYKYYLRRCFRSSSKNCSKFSLYPNKILRLLLPCGSYIYASKEILSRYVTKLCKARRSIGYLLRELLSAVLSTP